MFGNTDRLRPGTNQIGRRNNKQQMNPADPRKQMSQETSAPQIAIGPRVRKSPYFEATLDYGAKAFTIYNHMFMPTVYTDPVDEYWRLVQGVTLWDVACERQVEITGPDARQFTQLLTPRNLSNCSVGQCRYVVLTAGDGGIINDAVLLHLAEDHFWLSPGDGDVLLWAQGVATNTGLNVTVAEPDVSPLQLQGPKAPYVAKKLFGKKALDLGYYRMIETELDGIPLVLSRTGWSGELGYELFLRDGARGYELWETVIQAGKEHDIVPIAPSGIRSIEGAILAYCSDITGDDNPYVIGLDRLVDLEQEADFIGKAALKKIHAEGTKRRLVGFTVNDGGPSDANAEFWPVMNGSANIGRVTRAAYSPRLDKYLGFVNVPTDKSAVGTELAIETPDGRFDVTVAATPFVPAEKEIPPI